MCILFEISYTYHLFDTDFDFNSCPAWSTCKTHPVYSLWKRASQNVSLKNYFTPNGTFLFYFNMQSFLWNLICKNVRKGFSSLICIQFAEMACGNITVLLNGSIVNAFNRKR